MAPWVFGEHYNIMERLINDGVHATGILSL